MGLPTAMSEQTIATIKATAPVVAPVALQITQTFYNNLFEAHPELFSIFNRANMKSGIQPVALADSVVAYASHIDQLNALVGFQGSPVDVICNKHCGLNIQPDHYPIVHDFLMGAVGEVLGDAVTPEIGSAWSEAVLFLAKVLIDTEEGMYAAAAQRSGGWVGFQPFEVTEVCDVTDAVKCFTFVPKVANGGIAFTPGQFLSIKVDPNGDGLTAPRHYTITSSPGAPHLQCSVKRVEGGVVSSFMHDTLKPGDTVDLSPPFGCFTPRASTSKAVLLSGGIGVTPMLSFAESLGDKVALVAHVDASPAAHAYADRFAGFPTLFKYASEGGSVAPEALFEEIAARLDGGPSAHEFYICGSPGFQNAMTTTLKASGAKSVFSEAFKGHAD